MKEFLTALLCALIANAIAIIPYVKKKIDRLSQYLGTCARNACRYVEEERFYRSK